MAFRLLRCGNHSSQWALKASSCSKYNSTASISFSSKLCQTTCIPNDHIPTTFKEANHDRLQVDPNSSQITSLLEHLNLSFSEPELIRQVLTHSSYKLGRAPTNERLRQIGKKVLGLHLAEHHHIKDPELSSATIDDTLKIYYGPYALAAVGRVFGLNTLIKYRPDQGDNDKPHGFSKIVGKSIQALIGAIYHDKGANEAKKFIHKYIISSDVDAATLVPLRTPKVTLSALLRTMGKATPISKVIKQTGAFDSEPIFVVAVFSGSVKLSEKAGSSLRIAEFNACRDAIVHYHLKDLKDFKLPSDMVGMEDSSLTFIEDPSIDESAQLQPKQL